MGTIPIGLCITRHVGAAPEDDGVSQGVACHRTEPHWRVIAEESALHAVACRLVVTPPFLSEWQVASVSESASLCMCAHLLLWCASLFPPSVRAQTASLFGVTAPRF